MTELENKLLDYLDLKDRIRKEKLNIATKKEEFEAKISAQRLEFEKSINPIQKTIYACEDKSEKLSTELNDKLKVRLGDLIAEIRKVADLKEFDYIEVRNIKFPYFRGDYTNNIKGLLNNIQRNDYEPKQFELSISRVGEYKSQFYFYKNLYISDDIKFSDGSSLSDNLDTSTCKNKHDETLTYLYFKEPGKEMDMMIPFTVSELCEDKFLFRPVSLLRKAVINCVNKTQKPTM